MPYTTITYPITATRNNKVNLDTLQNSIAFSEAEGTGPFVSHFISASVDNGAQTFSLLFRDELDSGDKSILDAIVAAHLGLPYISAQAVTLTSPTQSDGTPMFVSSPRQGNEWVLVTHNFSDPCTWFQDSNRVTNETLTDSGDGYTFNSVNKSWVDMISGRMHNDDMWVELQQGMNPSNPHGYSVQVTINGNPVIMRVPFANTGGDYEVIWENGQILFYSNQSGNDVVASYSYATDSTFYVQPRQPGTYLVIEDSEADVTTDTIMNDELDYGYWELGSDGATWSELGGYAYKRAAQIVTEAKGAFPIIYALGATAEDKQLSLQEFRRKSRGTMSDRQILPFSYNTVLTVKPGAQIRMWLKNHIQFGGECVSMTFYCSEVEVNNPGD